MPNRVQSPLDPFESSPHAGGSRSPGGDSRESINTRAEVRADESRRIEERWRAVFDNACVGIALLDDSGHFVAINSAYERMLGYSLDDLNSKDCRDLSYDESDRLAFENLLDELRHGQRDRFELEKRDRRKDGAALWVRVNGSRLPERPGEMPLWVVLMEDITERKRIYAGLERERDRLRSLLDLTHQLIAKLDVSSAVESVLEVFHQRERWDVAEILLPDQLTGQLRLYGLEPELQDGRTIPIDGSAAGYVYLSGQHMVFRLDELPRLSPAEGTPPWVQDFFREKGVAAGCLLPLAYGGQVVGLLFLGTRQEEKFSPAELDHLQEVAHFLAAALDHALRFDALTASHEKLASERNYRDEQIRTLFEFEDIVGRSKAMQAVLQQVHTVAPTDSAVLILGETGTGKELIARAIHDRSPRKDQAFIKVDCAAIPATLLESELFGYEKGAFTGASGQKLGRLEIADRGTLFLDEVGDLPLELQSKLLRVLQDKAFERLGGNRTHHLDVRVTAATNRNLDEMVAKGEFRPDLYYRLKVFPILVPPLRDRPDDIPPLVWHYVHKYARRMRKSVDTIPAEAMEAFRRYPWPGNVRELQHFVERSVVLTSGSVLQAPLQALEHDSHARPAAGPTVRKARTLEEIEREAILEALRESNWVVGGPAGAARRLGLKRTTLASRIERLGISVRPSADSRTET